MSTVALPARGTSGAWLARGAHARWPLLLLLAITGALIGSAMRRTSATFDEVVMIAGGARGYHTGEWDFNPEHPPLVQYLYGLPVALARPALPPELPADAPRRQGIEWRYTYARQLFWGLGNDGQQLLLLGRLPALAAALGLVALAYGFVRRAQGRAAALLAAALVAFLPDVLAHGGVAYNDVPLALAYLAGLWAIDEAVRRPGARTAIVAGVACGLALGIKHSAVALVPAAALLLLAEGVARPDRGRWLRAVVPAALIGLTAVYATLVLCHRGDLALAQYRYGLGFAFRHVTSTPAVSYLLGTVSYNGSWYYFPVSFLYKTSAALQLLVVIAALHYARHSRRGLRLLASPLRAPAVGVLVFGVLLLSARQNIGFRYALPALVPLVLLTAVGIARYWQLAGPWLRRALVVAVAWAVLQPLGSYPFFISYVSEYGPGVGRNHEVLADSSLDWGQGLLALREWMRRERVGRIYLSYFGSASPGGYGIAYVPLPSYFPLPIPAPSPDTAEPRWVAISATNLAGVRFPNDPFAEFRTFRPARVVGGSIYLYDLQEVRR